MVTVDADGSNPVLEIDWQDSHEMAVNAAGVEVQRSDYDAAGEPGASRFMDDFVMVPVNNLLDSLTASK